MICEPKGTSYAKDGKRLPFNKKWFSHKFKGAGVHYEISSCIRTGLIVHVNGPFPCGHFPDITIFRKKLEGMLEVADEITIADRGYRGTSRCRTPDDWLTLSERRANSNARARHETINGKLKTFRALSTKFRHNRSQHKEFFAVAVVTVQLMMEEYSTTFHVGY